MGTPELGSLAAAPLMTAVIIAIDVEGGPPARCPQVRVGRGGRLSRLYKFRSMIEKPGAQSGAVCAGKEEPRITSKASWGGERERR